MEKNGADPTIASALLEAPAFLANLSTAEIALVKAKVEQQYLTPEIVASKAKVEKAMAELERGHRAAQALVAARGGLGKIPHDGAQKIAQRAVASIGQDAV